MLGFSKKRFFITLGLSILVWGASTIFQFFSLGNKIPLGEFGIGNSCTLTGYPISSCVPDYDHSGDILIFINLLFWFWLIHLTGGFLKKLK